MLSGFSYAVENFLSINADGGIVNATEGQSFSRQLASFSLVDSSYTPTSFSMDVNWDSTNVNPYNETDGSLQIVDDGGGNYSVDATAVYSVAGNYAVEVNIYSGSDFYGTVYATASIGKAALDLTAPAGSLTTVETAPFTGTVANFSDDNAHASAQDFSALITWETPNKRTHLDRRRRLCRRLGHHFQRHTGLRRFQRLQLRQPGWYPLAVPTFRQRRRRGYHGFHKFPRHPGCRRHLAGLVRAVGVLYGCHQRRRGVDRRVYRYRPGGRFQRLHGYGQRRTVVLRGRAGRRQTGWPAGLRGLRLPCSPIWH